jgi:hypothetical protein|tara:strand:- start:156 stop:446 length:291 start_codon:yes stop_codon:yes gene_type:complete
MNVKLSETELINLISDILIKVKFNTGKDEVGFYKLDGESELGEQESGTSSAGEGVGTAAMTNWESGVARGVGNQVAVSVNQSGYSALGRGKGNPLW